MLLPARSSTDAVERRSVTAMETTSRGIAAEVITRYCQAWQMGDMATLVGLYSDDVVLVWPGRHALAGEHCGKQAALDALIGFSVHTDRELATVHEVYGDNDHAVARVTERWIIDGAQIEVERLLRYRVVDGSITECVVYERDQYEVDALLGEPI